MNLLVENYKNIYNNAKPFKHLVIDNFFNNQMLEFMVEEFQSNKKWDIRNDEGIQVKTRSNWETPDDIPALIKETIDQLNSIDFIYWLSQITGEMILPDPYVKVGGINIMHNNNVLAQHIDGNGSKETGLYRYLNLIIYLSKDWKPEYGGQLVLGEGEDKVTIEPNFNRMVLFKTDDKSLHGVKRIHCPEGESRKSLILYYYTAKNNFNTDKEKKLHSAIFGKEV